MQIAAAFSLFLVACSLPLTASTPSEPGPNLESPATTASTPPKTNIKGDPLDSGSDSASSYPDSGMDTSVPDSGADASPSEVDSSADASSSASDAALIEAGPSDAAKDVAPAVRELEVNCETIFTSPIDFDNTHVRYSAGIQGGELPAGLLSEWPGLGICKAAEVCVLNCAPIQLAGHRMTLLY